MGRNEYDKLESALRVLLTHMLKWDHQPEKRSRFWENTILEQRDRAERQLRENPSLKSRLKEAMRNGYKRGAAATPPARPISICVSSRRRVPMTGMR